MPILTPPPSEDEPEREVVVKPSSWEEYRRVQLFLNVPSWKCSCGLTYQGRVLKCVRKECGKDRPSDYSKVRQK